MEAMNIQTRVPIITTASVVIIIIMPALIVTDY
jgi:hypothetical protein